MDIKLIEKNPSKILKAITKQSCSDDSENSTNLIVMFLVAVIAFLGVFYSLDPVNKASYDKAILIALLWVLISAFQLLFHYKQYRDYWNEFKISNRSVIGEKMFLIYEINSSGIVIKSIHTRYEYKWTAFKAYQETEDFIVLVTRKDEFVSNLWINKAIIGERDLKELLINLEDIFDFI
jgi:hypothetical protein